VLDARGAESLCARLCRAGVVDAAVSADGDALVHGCPVVLTNLSETAMQQGHTRVYHAADLTSPARWRPSALSASASASPSWSSALGWEKLAAAAVLLGGDALLCGREGALPGASPKCVAQVSTALDSLTANHRNTHNTFCSTSNPHERGAVSGQHARGMRPGRRRSGVGAC
jgi:hypothetical protein